jgi:outer membrane cobalamin receptor
VIDGKTNDVLIGAAVYIKELKIGTTSRLDGSYVFRNIPAGTYTMLVKYLSYVDLEIQVTLVENEVVEFDFRLAQNPKLLSEVTVVGNSDKASELSARSSEMHALQIINVVSAEKIESLPDLTLADVMQRVSGVSMTKSNFGTNSNLIIRGMPSRYNSVLVDRVVMPSTSTSGRSVNLDLYGSELVGRVEVIKALTPDLEADGIGGTVNIKMKEAPDSAFFKIQAGLGYSQYYFNHNFLTFDKSNVAKKDFSELHGPDYLADESEFPRQNLIAKEKPAVPNLNLGFSLGKRFLDRKFGAMFSVNIRENSVANTYDYTSYVPAFSTGKPAVEYTENQVYSTNQKRYGAYAMLDYKFNGNNQIGLFSSLFQVNELRVREYADRQTENGGQFIRPITTQTETDNSGILSNSLRGKHNLSNNLELNWTLVYASGNSRSPDFANIDLAKGGSNPPTLNYTRPVVRVWQWDIDENKSAYLNLTYRPTLFNHLIEFKTGGLYRMKFRKNYANEYFFQPYDDASANNYKNFPNPDLLTVPLRNDQNDQEKKGNAYLNPGNYRAWENIGAAYAMINATFGDFQIVTGLRFESTNMHNEHNQNNVQIPVATASVKYYDFFPSLHVIRRIDERRNLRMSVYRAINRPTYTELIPYSDPRAGGQIGNPKLLPAYGTCADMRYEIYPQPEEVLSAGIFYKTIKNAIEDILTQSNNSQPSNVPAATTNYGLELVAFKYFGNVGVGANYTYTQSRISDKAVDYVYKDTVLIANPLVNYTRTLVGQSPHLFNLSLTYRNSRSGLKSGISYTMQGDNLSALNNSHLHFNRYQATYHDLGLTFEQRIGARFIVQMKISNLLNSPLIWYMKEENGVLIRKSYNYQVYTIQLRYSI